MLIKKLPHLLVTLLVAILVGCGSSNPLADEAQSNFENQKYEAALASAEQSIEQHPGDARGYYYKAVALGGIAESIEDPTERTDLYKQMLSNFETAKQVADTSESAPGELERIPVVKQAYWRTEFNRGVELATDDSVKSTVENPMVLSMQHIKNSTLILPEESNSWNALAQVSFQNKEYQQAVDAKGKYMEMIADTSLKVDDYRQLAYYYQQMDKDDKVLEVYENARDRFPENTDVITGLADAYLRTGQSQKAISALEQLVQQDPQNAHYRLVMGTNIYQQALTLRDSVVTNSDKIRTLQDQHKSAKGAKKEELKSQITTLSNENEKLMARVEELTDRAEKEIKEAVEIRPDDAAAYETLGVIYQNRAKTVFDQRNRTTDNEKAAALDKKGKELIRKAMTYYEKAVEIEPDNKNYWRSLSQIYPFLGMDEKAKEAMKKAGM